jgi:hypothetical protein
MGRTTEDSKKSQGFTVKQCTAVAVVTENRMENCGTQVGLPLVEPIKRIVIGAEVPRHPSLPSNGTVEHPTKCGTIDRSRMDAEANDPARVLIHDHQDPVGLLSSCYAL